MNKQPNPQYLIDELPETTYAFRKFHDAAFADGALSKKQKELIATAISVALRCSPCIHTHTTKAVELGNSKNEIAEAISVGFLMGGGPAFVYASEALELLTNLAKENSSKPPNNPTQ